MIHTGGGKDTAIGLVLIWWADPVADSVVGPVSGGLGGR